MSLYGALFSGVSGLSSQSSAMSAIADNVTNVNTVGYKGTRVNFQTLITKQVSLTQYSSGGVQSKPRQSVDTQGLLQSSSSSTDIAISGNGMFICNEASTPVAGNRFAYTRAGSFKVDRSGYLQNVGGWYMQGWPLMPWDNSNQSVKVQVGNNMYMKAYKDTAGTTSYVNDNIVSAEHLKPLNLNEMAGTATQTRNIRLGANLPSTDDVGANHKTNVLVYDSLGNDHNVQYSWTKMQTNGWDLEVTPPEYSTSLAVQNSAGLTYSSMGRLDFLKSPATGDAINFSAGNDPSNAAWNFHIAYGNADDLTDTDTDYAYTIDLTSRTASQVYDATVTTINNALNIANSTTTGTVAIGAGLANLVVTDSSGVSTTIDISAAGTAAQIAQTINAAGAGLLAQVDTTGNSIVLASNNTSGITVSDSDMGVTLGQLGFTSSSLSLTGKTYAERLASTDSIVMRQGSTSHAMSFNTAGLNSSASTVVANNQVAMTTGFNTATGVSGVAGTDVLTVTDLTTNTAVTIDVSTASDIKTMLNTINGGASGLNAEYDFVNQKFILTNESGHALSVSDGGAGAGLSAMGFTAAVLVPVPSNNAAVVQQQSAQVNSVNAGKFTVAAISQALTPATTNAINFNGDGTPASFNISSVDIMWANGATDQTGSDKISMFLGNSNIGDGMTQFAGQYQISYINQNGAKFGNFAGVTIGRDGVVTAMFDNGVTRPVFMIPVATFVNPNGMENLTGNVWLATDVSGDPTLREAGTAGAGQINAGSLEASTVDLGEEFSTMITTQRAYSASAKIITTSDQMLDELVNIKR